MLIFGSRLKLVVLKNHSVMFLLRQGNLAQAKYAEKIHSASLAWARCTLPEQALSKKGRGALGLIFAQARSFSP